MPDDYHSFLIRYWRRAGEARRLTIEHIPSGQRGVVTSLQAALIWIEACCATQAIRAPPSSPPGGDLPVPGKE
jgi:hypothetical protein